jgi:hypothetical protein
LKMLVQVAKEFPQVSAKSLIAFLIRGITRHRGRQIRHFGCSTAALFP